MYGGYHEAMGGGGWVLMALLLIALLAVVVWAVVRLAPGRGEADHERHEVEPLEILDRRLARGDIDPDEYRRVRSALGGPTVTGTGGS